ncbi:MAG: lysylphosphatidylglycerol synthase domain-containing protein [Haloferacaceae archaeon]
MRTRGWLRVALGVAAGGGAVAAYLVVVGAGNVVDRVTAVAPPALALVVLLVVAEGVADGVGVWASIRPLGDGLSAGQSVQFALAGDFFDTLSPAGPVSSEPIVAQFVGVTTGTSYSEALGVRAVAKYVKSGTQLLVSTGLAVVLLGGPMPAAATSVVAVVVGAAALLLVGGAVLLRHHALAGRALVAALAPVLARVPRVGCDREATARAVERFGSRALLFRSAPGLVALIAVGGLLEQVLSAAALYVALGAVGVPVPALPLLALVPFPQAASLVPVPGSVGAYDGAMSGGLVLVAGVPAAAALAAVLVVRTVSVPFALAAGGVSAAFLRGWRPGA